MKVSVYDRNKGNCAYAEPEKARQNKYPALSESFRLIAFKGITHLNKI